MDEQSIIDFDSNFISIPRNQLLNEILNDIHPHAEKQAREMIENSVVNVNKMKTDLRPEHRLKGAILDDMNSIMLREAILQNYRNIINEVLSERKAQLMPLVADIYTPELDIEGFKAKIQELFDKYRPLSPEEEKELIYTQINDTYSFPDGQKLE